MTKWILLMFAVYWGIWYAIASTSSYTPISQQIDVKSMSLKTPEYVEKKWDICDGTCKNRSSTSTSSWWSASYGGK